MTLSEDDLIATLFAPLAGPGGLGLLDDAALLSPGLGEEIVVTVDAIVAGVHFFPDDPPASIAIKALGVNLSDLAAKAARPAGFLLVLALPPEADTAWLQAFSQALGETAKRHASPLLGGDTVRTPGPLTISITAFGTVPRGTMMPRTGARVGDRLYVSGTIGDAALGLALRLGREGLGTALVRLLDPAAQDHLTDRYLHPAPRLGLRAALQAHASAAMDVSDGLVGDLRKMLRASRVGGRVDLGSVPLSQAAAAAVALHPEAFETAVTGGDDYEVLTSVPQPRAAAFEAAAREAGIAVTPIGVVESDAGVAFTRDAQPVDYATGSFQHF
jgi:thiamine-monophosphate kinase